LRLLVEQLQVARAAAHEQVNDALRLRLVVRLRQLIGSVRLARERAEGDRTEADAAVAQEPPAVDELLPFGEGNREHFGNLMWDGQTHDPAPRERCVDAP